MLRDRSAAVGVFALVSALELRFEPELAELDRPLEDDQIFHQVKADLSRWRAGIEARPEKQRGHCTPAAGGATRGSADLRQYVPATGARHKAVRPANLSIGANRPMCP